MAVILDGGNVPSAVKDYVDYLKMESDSQFSFFLNLLAFKIIFKKV